MLTAFDAGGGDAADAVTAAIDDSGKMASMTCGREEIPACMPVRTCCMGAGGREAKCGSSDSAVIAA